MHFFLSVFIMDTKEINQSLNKIMPCLDIFWLTEGPVRFRLPENDNDQRLLRDSYYYTVTSCRGHDGIFHVTPRRHLFWGVMIYLACLQAWHNTVSEFTAECPFLELDLLQLQRRGSLFC